MSQGDSHEKILKKVEPNRRESLRRVLAGAVFAAPVIATFSIDSLSPQTAAAQSFTNAPYTCQPDPGYVGPASFQAHLANLNDPFGPAGRVHGEVQLWLNDDGRHSSRHLRTSLILVQDAVVTNADLFLNGNFVAVIKAGKGTIDPGDVSTNIGLCDFDQLLQGMAIGQAYVSVSGTYFGYFFYLTASLTAGDTPIVNLHP